MIGFLVSAVLISLSGVMAPGPMTAATLAAGTQSRHAGMLIALGHAVIELPLMILLITGVGQVFDHAGVKTAIGLAGGCFLLWMGADLVRASRRAGTLLDSHGGADRRPFYAGIVLTAANPYFLIWWATVGLALATQAVAFGVWAFALFAVVHWLCDLVWLEALSWASHKGVELMGSRTQRIIPLVCGLVLLGFGVLFLYDALKNLTVGHA